MWSKPLLCRFRQPGENPLSPVPQGFAGFCPSRAWIGSTRSQSKRATNCANPGFLVIEFCTRCGQTCGQADFLTTLACGESASIAGVSRDCRDSVFQLERKASCSQTVCGNLAYYTSFLRVLQEGETLRMGGICRTTIHIEQEYNTRHGLQAIQ